MLSAMEKSKKSYIEPVIILILNKNDWGKVFLIAFTNKEGWTCEPITLSIKFS